MKTNRGTLIFLMNSKKYIVVTGGAGFIGSNMIKVLLKKTKFRIISIDNYQSGDKKNHIKNTRVKYIKSDTSQINIKLKKIKRQINAIFHFGEFARIFQSFLNLRLLSIQSYRDSRSF